MTEPINWPTKTRQLHNHHFDSSIWSDFPLRDDDIIIATYAKAGTTWLQGAGYSGAGYRVQGAECEWRWWAMLGWREAAF